MARKYIKGHGQFTIYPLMLHSEFFTVSYKLTSSVTTFCERASQNLGLILKEMTNT